MSIYVEKLPKFEDLQWNAEIQFGDWCKLDTQIVIGMSHRISLGYFEQIPITTSIQVEAVSYEDALKKAEILYKNVVRQFDHMKVVEAINAISPAEPKYQDFLRAY